MPAERVVPLRAAWVVAAAATTVFAARVWWRAAQIAGSRAARAEAEPVRAWARTHVRVAAALTAVGLCNLGAGLVSLSARGRTGRASLAPLLFIGSAALKAWMAWELDAGYRRAAR